MALKLLIFVVLLSNISVACATSVSAATATASTWITPSTNSTLTLGATASTAVAGSGTITLIFPLGIVPPGPLSSVILSGASAGNGAVDSASIGAVVGVTNGQGTVGTQATGLSTLPLTLTGSGAAPSDGTAFFLIQTLSAQSATLEGASLFGKLLYVKGCTGTAPGPYTCPFCVSSACGAGNAQSAATVVVVGTPAVYLPSATTQISMTYTLNALAAWAVATTFKLTLSGVNILTAAGTLTSTSLGSIATNADTTATSFPSIVISGVPTKFGISQQPSTTATAGVPLSTNAVFTLLDASNNIVAGTAGSYFFNLTTLDGSNNYVNVGLSCTSPSSLTNIAFVSGTFTVSSCTLTKSGSVFLAAVPFVASAFTLVASSQIAVAAAAVSKVVYSTPPPGTLTAGTTFSTVFAAQDTFSNTNSSYASSFTMSISSDAAGNSPITTSGFACTTPASLSGSFTSGTFTTSACQLLVAGTYYLVINSGQLTKAVSSSIVVSSMALPTKLTITTQPSASSTTGTALAVQPVVAARDTYNNTVQSFVGNYNISLSSDASGSTSVSLTAAGFSCTSATSNASFVAGVGTSTGCVFTVAGTYYFVFSSASFSSVSSSVVVSASSKPSASAGNVLEISRITVVILVLSSLFLI